MHPDRTRSHDPAGLKRCSACGEEKRAADFYASGGRLSSYCKDCQRQASRLAYRQRRQDLAVRARMRSVDRLRKRRERARLAQLDPDRERCAGRGRLAPLGGVERPRRVVRFARLMHRRGRALSVWGPQVNCQ
jgi:hypothetical protein